MEAKTKKILFGVVVGGLAIWGIILAVKKFGGTSKKTEKQMEDDDKQKQEEQKKQAETNNQPPPPPPADTDKSFPLSVGNKGSNVLALQKALNNAPFNSGISPVKGYFGSITEGAVKAAGYSVPLSKDDYDAILSGKKKAVKGAYSKGQPIYAKTPIYVYSKAINDPKYQVQKFDTQDGIGLFVRPSTVDGWIVLESSKFNTPNQQVFVQSDAVTNVKA